MYFLGLVLVLVFTQLLPWFPSQAPQGDTLGQVLSQPNALVLPVVAGAASMVAVFSRYMRAATLENLSEDYVRTARAGGSRPRAILFGGACSATHYTPVVAMLGYCVAGPLRRGPRRRAALQLPRNGAAVLERRAVLDYPVLLGCVLVISVATVVGTLLADMVQRIVDPRVEAGRS